MEENDLIQKARGGDMRAFSDLVRLHDRAILSLAARFAGNAEDAKDIFQEVLINVYRGLPAFAFRSAFATWIHRITVNACLSHRRKRQPAWQIPIHAAVEGEPAYGWTEELVSSPDPGPYDAAVQADAADQVRRALMNLSPRQRMVFTLHHDEGYTLKEIGLSLRCAEGTVKRYLFTATRRLREQLGHMIEKEREGNG